MLWVNNGCLKPLAIHLFMGTSSARHIILLWCEKENKNNHVLSQCFHDRRYAHDRHRRRSMSAGDLFLDNGTPGPAECPSGHEVTSCLRRPLVAVFSSSTPWKGDHSKKRYLLTTPDKTATTWVVLPGCKKATPCASHLANFFTWRQGKVTGQQNLNKSHSQNLLEDFEHMLQSCCRYEGMIL